MYNNITPACTKLKHWNHTEVYGLWYGVFKRYHITYENVVAQSKVEHYLNNYGMLLRMVDKRVIARGWIFLYFHQDFGAMDECAGLRFMNA